MEICKFVIQSYNKETIVAEKLEKVDFIISSDLIRAKETSKILSDELGITIVYNKDLREINNGDLADLSIDEFKVKYPGLFFDTLQIKEKYPNGESPYQFYKRIRLVLGSLILNYEDKRIVIVTHGGVIGVIKSLVSGYEWSNKQKYKIQNCECLKLLINSESINISKL